MTKEEIYSTLVEKITAKYLNVDNLNVKVVEEFQEVLRHMEVLKEYEVDEEIIVQKIGLKFPKLNPDYYKKNKPYSTVDPVGLVYLQLGYLFGYIHENEFFNTLIQHI